MDILNYNDFLVLENNGGKTKVELICEKIFYINELYTVKKLENGGMFRVDAFIGLHSKNRNQITFAHTRHMKQKCTAKPRIFVFWKSTSFLAEILVYCQECGIVHNLIISSPFGKTDLTSYTKPFLFKKSL
jgi:hypothetical protein